MNNIMEFLMEQDIFSEFELVNIFPIRSANGSNLVKRMSEYGEYQKKNDSYIKKVLKNSKKVLVAWGQHYHNQAAWIFKYLKDKEVYVYSINSDGTPTNFARQSYTRVYMPDLLEYDIEKFV